MTPSAQTPAFLRGRVRSPPWSSQPYMGRSRSPREPLRADPQEFASRPAPRAPWGSTIGGVLGSPGGQMGRGLLGCGAQGPLLCALPGGHSAPEPRA